MDFCILHNSLSFLGQSLSKFVFFMQGRVSICQTDKQLLLFIKNSFLVWRAMNKIIAGGVEGEEEIRSTLCTTQSQPGREGERRREKGLKGEE